MIWRLGGTVARLGTVAVAKVSILGARVTSSEPVIWYFFGYPFEAAGMIAALFGCLMSRWWIGAGQWARKQYRVQLDLPVTGVVLAVAAATVIARRPEPFGALAIGIGVGVVGEGVFKFAENYILRGLKLFGGEVPPPAP